MSIFDKVIKEKKIFQDYNFLKNGSGAGNDDIEYRKIWKVDTLVLEKNQIIIAQLNMFFRSLQDMNEKLVFVSDYIREVQNLIHKEGYDKRCRYEYDTDFGEEFKSHQFKLRVGNKIIMLASVLVDYNEQISELKIMYCNNISAKKKNEEIRTNIVEVSCSSDEYISVSEESYNIDLLKSGQFVSENEKILLEDNLVYRYVSPFENNSKKNFKKK